MLLHSLFPLPDEAHPFFLLDLEQKVLRRNSRNPSPPLFHFGFSHAVNVTMCSSAKSQKQTVAAIDVIPLDRLLAESDLRSHIYGGTAAALWYLAQCRGIAITEMAHITTRNAQRMLEAHRRAAVGKPS